MPTARTMFEGLKTIVVDELHAFAKEKRGDLLSLSMSRLQKFAPGLRRVGLSATISDPDAYRGWLAPDADTELVDVVIGDPGAEPDLSILIPDGRIPWSGHSGPPRRARGDGADRAAQDHAHFLQHPQPRRADFPGLVGGQRQGAADRHPPRQPGARGTAQGRSRQWRGQAARPGRHRQPRPRHRLGRHRSGRPDGRAQGQLAAAPAHRPRQPPARRAEQGRRSCPATASNISRPARHWTRSTTASSTPRTSAPARSTCSPSTFSRSPAPSPFEEQRAADRIALRRTLCGPARRDISGGAQLHRHRRLRAQGLRQVPPAGPRPRWPLAHHPAGRRAAASPQCRRSSSRRPCSSCASRTAAASAPSRKALPSTLSPGDHFFFSGLSLEVERIKDGEIYVHASSKSARIVTYGGQRMSMSTHLANRVRHMLCRPQRLAPLSRRRARMAGSPGRALGPARARPIARRDIRARRPALHGRLQLRGLERPPVAGHADHQADGESRAQAAGLRRQRLRPRLLRAGADHATRRRSSRRTFSSASSSTGSSNPICSRTRFAKWR